MAGASPPPLRFAGYAALFDIADAARDTIRPGAFTQTLLGRRSPVPLFWQHRPDAAIGVIETIAEDSRGLRVIGRIDNPFGRSAQMLRRGEASGLSFGYRASEYRRGDPRSEEHTSELQSLMRISYAVFCLKKKKNTQYLQQHLQTQITKTSYNYTKHNN